MVKLGIVQIISYSSNQQALKNISRIIKSLGRSETDIVTLPEQWLQNNRISDLSPRQKSIRKAIENSKVYFEEFRLET